MDGRCHTLSRYLAQEAERLVCAVALIVAMGVAVVGCWIGSACAARGAGRNEVLAWHALPAAWWLWLFVRAASSPERIVSWTAFGIAFWTLWLALWMPHHVLERPPIMIALLTAPTLAALTLLAIILRRRALRQIRSASARQYPPS